MVIVTSSVERHVKMSHKGENRRRKESHPKAAQKKWKNCKK
jgi:hypothetical protein